MINNLQKHENFQRDSELSYAKKKKILQITNYTVIDLQIDKPACTSEGEQYRTVWINLNIKMIRKITIRFFHRYILLYYWFELLIFLTRVKSYNTPCFSVFTLR